MGYFRPHTISSTVFFYIFYFNLLSRSMTTMQSTLLMVSKSLSPPICMKPKQRCSVSRCTPANLYSYSFSSDQRWNLVIYLFGVIAEFEPFNSQCGLYGLYRLYIYEIVNISIAHPSIQTYQSYFRIKNSLSLDAKLSRFQGLTRFSVHVYVYSKLYR